MPLLTTYLRPEWPRAVLLGVLLFVGIGLQLANPQIARVFIDHAQAGEPLDQLVWIALVFMAIVLLSQVATVAETYVAEDLGWRTTNALRADLAHHVLELDAELHASHTTGELIERIDGDVSAIADFFARFVVQVLGSAVFLVGVLVLLYVQDWRIGAILTVSVIAALVWMTRGGGFVAVRSRVARKTTADLMGYLEERLGGLLDIKSNGGDVEAVRGLNARLEARFRTGRASVLAASIFNAIVGVLFVLGAGGALATGAALYGAGALTLGSVYAVFRYTTMLRQPLDRLTRQMNAFQTAAGGIARVQELLSTQRHVLDGDCALPDGALAVELEHVTFGYAEDVILRGISLRLEPQILLGVLGRTGSGKTTLSRLLFRLHDPTHGVVRVGGSDLRNISGASLRQRIGLVTQEVQLFQATLRDNVALFDPSMCDSRLLDVFQSLGLEDWLAGLPAGLDTVLGGSDRGLSAGEAQCIALARVFLRDPGLVILDEASSRLDPATERLIEGAVTRLLYGRTGVVIAHRLATVQRTDQILILEDGRVVEFGPRRDLLADRRSRFAQLVGHGMSEALA